LSFEAHFSFKQLFELETCSSLIEKCMKTTEN
jgi:hypothetical protein